MSTEQLLREENEDLREQVDQYRVALEAIQEHMMANASRSQLEQYRAALQSAHVKMDTQTDINMDTHTDTDTRAASRACLPRGVLMSDGDALEFYERVNFTEDDFRQMSKEELVQSLKFNVDSLILTLRDKKRLKQEVDEFQSMRHQLDAKESEVKQLNDTVLQLREQVAALHEAQLRANPPVLVPEAPPVSCASMKRDAQIKTTRSANKANKAKLAAELEEQQRFAVADAFKRQQEKRRQTMKRAMKNCTST